jgi:transposase-like protein
MNLIDVNRKFTNDAECLAYLEAQRWASGVRCVTCGGDRISRITRQKKTKNLRGNLYQCLENTCNQQFTSTSGTIFHDSHLTLTQWFTAVALICDAKKSLSALQLQRHLGIGSYRTAWYLAHRIRKAMEETEESRHANPLKGTIEADETYIGGKYDKRRKRGPYEKPGVMGMLERGGKVRTYQIPTASKDVLVGTIRNNTDMEARIMTDESTAYKSLGALRKHDSVAHSKLEWVRGDVHTNGIENYWSLLKRGVVGSFHQISKKYLDLYMMEFEYRFNNRKTPELFVKTIGRMCQTGVMELKALKADKPSVAL